MGVFAYMQFRAALVCLVPTDIGRGCQMTCTGITDGSELICGVPKFNTSPLEDQPELLSTELSPYPQVYFLNRYFMLYFIPTLIYTLASHV